MKIRKIQLENFRCFERLSIELKDSVNIFIGNNGSGKSAVLDGLSVALGVIATRLPDVSGVSFKNDDLRQVDDRKLPYTRVSVETVSGHTWDVTKKRDKSKRTAQKVPKAKGMKELSAYLDIEITDRYNQALDFELPFFAYYGVSRAILDIPLSRKGFQKKISRFDALAGALLTNNRFRSAFTWFYNKENEESRKQRNEKSFDVTLKELDVVRDALRKMFPDLSEPQMQVNPLRFTVKKDGQTFSLNQLSDGYKTMMGLVLDLSARMATANPDHANPLESPAVVMIDEIDLHLHPTWQRRVIGDLIRTFPGTQFIMTTHSPYIVESLNNQLKKDKIKQFLDVADDINQIQPISPEHVSAYLLDDGTITNIMDEDINGQLPKTQIEKLEREYGIRVGTILHSEACRVVPDLRARV